MGRPSHTQRRSFLCIIIENSMTVLVVLNFNDAKTTEKLVLNVAGYDSIDKVVIVDNCSVDNSYERLKEISKNDKVICIKTDKNKGFASGNNYGARYAIKEYNADYIIFANPDVEFSDNTVCMLRKALEGSKKSGLATCKVVNRGHAYDLSAWKQPAFLDCVLECFILLQKLFGKRNSYPKAFYSGSILKVDVVQGSFFMMKASAFKDVEGMDENTFLYYEENILACRLKDKGYEELLRIDTEYVHRHSETIDKNISLTRTKFEYLQKSRKYYCQQYLKVSPMLMMLLDIAYRIGITDYELLRRVRG